MKKYFALLFVVLMYGNNAVACDACGCAVSGSGIGLLNNYRTNIIGFRYSNVHFQASELLEGRTKDWFQQGELFARVQVANRWRVSAQLPFQWNKRETYTGNHQTEGLSDLRILGHFAFIDNTPIGKKGNLYWELGAGAKMPTGKYDPDLLDQDMPDNFNPGNGSWALLAQSNLVFTYGKYGLNLITSAQFNSESSSGYQFGNQYSAALMAFADYDLGIRSKIVPFAGFTAEKITGDQLANGNSAHSTGSEGIFGVLGANVRYDRWQLGGTFSQPLTQNYSDGEVDAKRRFTVELNFFF